MRIASKNRFRRLVIKKVRYNNAGTVLNQDLSIPAATSSGISKPTRGVELSYDHREIAGSAL